MKLWSIGLLVGSLVLVGGPDPSKKQGIHRLKDGTLLEGRLLKSRNRVRIATPLGTRAVDATEYAGQGQVSLEALRAQYTALRAKVGKGTPEERVAQHQRLARWCLGEGYLTGLRRELNAILKIDVDHTWSRKLLRQIASSYRLHPGEGSDRNRSQRKLVDFLFLQLAPEDNVGAVLAHEKAVKLPSKLVLRPAMKAMRHSRTRVRWCGTRTVSALEDSKGRISPLFKRSISDGNWVVRREATRGLKAMGADDFVSLYVKQLGNPKAELRVRAAQALGELGSKKAIAPLVKAVHAPGSPRSYIAVTRQTSYVKDYDVEVAQTAFIADPIVDVIQDGAVLDVSVISVTTERRVYANALRRLTGADLGPSSKAWKEWLAGQK